MAESEKEGKQEVEEVDEEEEEYVLLDMDSVAHHIHIPENAPYVLTVISPPQMFLVLKALIHAINGANRELLVSFLTF